MNLLRIEGTSASARPEALKTKAAGKHNTSKGKGDGEECLSYAEDFFLLGFGFNVLAYS